MPQAAETASLVVGDGVEVYCRCGGRLGVWKSDGFHGPRIVFSPLPGGRILALVARCPRCRKACAVPILTPSGE